MRRWPLVCALVALALALPATPAMAESVTKSFDHPVSMDPFEVEQAQAIQTPGVEGWVTRMSVDVVNPDGTQVPINRVMLHHIVFAKIGTKHPGCDTITGFDEKTKIGAYGEPFYAAGEERQVMELPPGYGYRMKADDPLYMVWMLMNHRAVKDDVMIRYTVTYETDVDAPVKPVRPLWMDVVNCKADPVYDIQIGRAHV
jgi:hypothetical protein